VERVGDLGFLQKWTISGGDTFTLAVSQRERERVFMVTGET
jgi:hypothetical protein